MEWTNLSAETRLLVSLIFGFGIDTCKLGLLLLLPAFSVIEEVLHLRMYTLSETIMLSTRCRTYLASEAPFLLDPLPGLSLLLFGFEPQEFLLFSSFLIIAIEGILDLSAMFCQISIRNQYLRDLP